MNRLSSTDAARVEHVCSKCWAKVFTAGPLPEGWLTVPATGQKLCANCQHPPGLVSRPCGKLAARDGGRP